LIEAIGGIIDRFGAGHIKSRLFANVASALCLLVVVEAGAHEMSVLKGPARAVRHSECLKCKKHCYRQGNTSQKRFHGLVSFYSGCNNRRNSHSAL
jgi:hypothetical protein